jgi:hypothetical protein
MKTTMIVIAALTAAAGFVLATRTRANSRIPLPVEQLAHQLEDAWADHHTVA